MSDRVAYERMFKNTRKAEEHLFFKLKVSVLTEELQMGLHEESEDLFRRSLQELYNRKLELQKKKSCSRYIMVTLNFPHWEEPPTLEYLNQISLTKQIQKYVNRKIVPSAIWCYEYYTNGENHFHVHMLIDTLGNISYSDFIRNTRSTFSKVEGLNLDSIDFAQIVDKNLLSKYKYIRGIKERSKMPNVLQDRRWRVTEGFADYFEKDFAEPEGFENKYTD